MHKHYMYAYNGSCRAFKSDKLKSIKRYGEVIVDESRNCEDSYFSFDDIEYDNNMRSEVYEAFVSSVTFYKCGEQYRISAKVTNHFIGQYFQKRDFGKIVFLTKEEADAKLKETI